MAIAGIEGLAQGFMQGMAIKRQNDRQDVLDAQNLERFGMDKERFATQQAASAFELQNAQTNAANAAMDRTRNLRIQADQDAFDVKMKRLLSTGDDNLATLAEVEKVHIEDGVKGAFQRDPKTGVILTDEKGFATWINADGSPPQKHTGDSARKLFFAKQYPKDAMTREINNADTIASENRKEKTAIAAEDREAKTAATVAATLHSYRMSEKAQELLAAKLARAEAKDAELDAKDITTLFSVPITVTDADGKIKISQQVNQENLTNYLQWTKKNKVRMTPTTFRDWRAEIPSSGTTDTTTSGTDTYKSKSQGDLTVTGGLDKESGAVDMSGRSKLGSQGAAQPASPVSGLTVRPPAQAQEKTEVATPAKPVKKVQVLTKISGIHNSKKYTKINNPYQEIQGKYGDPIPDGFKRKSSYGDIYGKEYNTFVSNNYQD